ncbi:MAG: hypothetical protein RLZZ611_1883 [Cyanobacteriota bacterium]
MPLKHRLRQQLPRVLSGSLLSRSRTWPLPITGLTTALLLALPAALLVMSPRRSATGLERLIPSAALLQSFPAEPAAAPPPLWRQRLGPDLAGMLWPQQRRLWWQFWGAHGDAGAYLVLQLPRHAPLPAQALRVDDLVVVAPNPLARQLLRQELQVRRRVPRGLALRCSQRLQEREAVHWNAAALSQMFGPLAPLAQQQQQGCLVLSGQGRELLWQGEADASDGSLAPPPPALAVPPAQPLPATQLLELRGRRLDLLLQGPLSSPLLRQSLSHTYGLNPAVLQVLQRSDFQLRLRSVQRGPFQAALELQLAVSGERRVLERWLSELQQALVDQGLESNQPAAGLTTWSREDGRVVGGWRWLQGQRQLLLFLGPVPSRIPTSPPLAGVDWRLRLQPSALAAAGLLPPGSAVVLRRADQLLLLGQPQGMRAGERRSALAGRLNLP